jgi:hypothetical protein
MGSIDTAPSAATVQAVVHRAMAPGRRLEVAFEMSAQANDLAAAGIRSRHPDYDESGVTWALRRHRLRDDALFLAAWPGAPLLDP